MNSGRPPWAWVRSESLTTVRTAGGLVRSVVAQSVGELLDVLERIRNDQLSPVVIGEGSNSVIQEMDPDDRVFIRLPEGTRINESDGRIWAWAGSSMPSVARQAALLGIGGYEWLAGIPGSIGGAVCMNAGAFGYDMSNLVSEVEVIELSSGLSSTFTGDELRFEYRVSAVNPTTHVVILVKMNTGTARPQSEIQALKHQQTRYRRKTQPRGWSLGSTFMRDFSTSENGISAGEIIESAGLKGHARGSVAVSTQHANFILNTGGATSKEYLALVDEVQQYVAIRKMIDLKKEIRLL